MKSFNLNDIVYVDITEYGWAELKKQYSADFIEFCILSKKVSVNGKDYYALQAHNIPDWFGNMVWATYPSPINANILIP